VGFGTYGSTSGGGKGAHRKWKKKI
jgi:hypothetical protein